LRNSDDEEEFSEKPPEVLQRKDTDKDRQTASPLQPRTPVKLKPLVKAETLTSSTLRQRTPTSRTDTQIDMAATSNPVKMVEIPSFVTRFMSRPWFDKYFFNDVSHHVFAHLNKKKTARQRMHSS
jgi:hypothetical protein